LIFIREKNFSVRLLHSYKKSPEKGPLKFRHVVSILTRRVIPFSFLTTEIPEKITTWYQQEFFPIICYSTSTIQNQWAVSTMYGQMPVFGSALN